MIDLWKLGGKQELIRRRRVEFRCFLLVCWVMVWWATISCPFPDQPLLGQQPVLLECDDLVESSGVAVSPSDSDFIWTHNDSGHPPRIYLFNRLTGKLRGTFELRGASSVDWEDMAAFSVGGKNFLAIGDIGDNRKRRSSIHIHIIEEPRWEATPVTQALEESRPGGVNQIIRRLTLQFTYPTGPVDCEALVFDAELSRFLLLTKELLRCRVFSVPVDLSLLDSIPLPQIQEPLSLQAEYVQTLRIPIVTAADLSPDGRVLAVGTYGPAYMLSRDGAKWQERSMVRVPLPKRRQGEALAFLGSSQLVLTSEFAPTPLWTVDLPEEAFQSD